MPDRHEAEALFLQNLGWIDRVCASLCRRHGIAGDDADEFASWARAALIENDYAILRKFRGESAPTTYLTIVLSTLFSAWRVREHGRWRPSAAARREGPLAVRLEAMVHRDGLRLDEAAERLRTTGATTLSDRELASLLGRLPAHALPRPVPAAAEVLDETPAPHAAADRTALEAEAGALRERSEAAVQRALSTLEPEDRVVVKMRFWEGLTVAEVARGLGVPQKPLYRRLERAMARLRGELEREGVSRERVRELLDEVAP
jgi:RNA polymerase sigma factor for flagellar operon FliA